MNELVDTKRIDKRPNVFVIGDIHGEYHLFKKLLELWKSEEEQLILLGDLIDRGLHSKSVVEEVVSLAGEDKSNPVICLMGNHEELFLDFLNFPDIAYESYIAEGGGTTLSSFLGEEYVLSHTPEEVAAEIKRKYQKEVGYLSSLPRYYKRNNCLFVHAGVNINYKNFRHTEDQDFTWIREEFIENSNVLFEVNDTTRIPEAIKIVHGHTPTPDAPKFYKNRINIDGGAVFGGSLVGIKLDVYNDVKNIYKVKNTFELAGSEFY